MKILLTGNLGYIGSVLGPVLMEKGHKVTGFDLDYYRGCELEPLKPVNGGQIYRDIRQIEAEDLKGIEGVIHLAALSNDPLGEFDASLTNEINFQGTIRLAKLAKAAGVKRFVYASSQSMYGVSDTSTELEEDNSEKNPVTEYAKTKWEAEVELKKMNSPEFCVVCMRPSTVFGASPRLRCDIVYNYFVGCAFTTGKIEIKSDGTPWRPVVHVRDVASAFIAGLEAPASKVSGQSFNVGIENGNFTVRDLAEAAQRQVPGSSLFFSGEHGNDSRTYRVSFKKIFEVLGDFYKPEWNLDRGGRELVDFFKRVKFSSENFTGKTCNRLKQIKNLVELGEVDKKLHKKEGSFVGKSFETIETCRSCESHSLSRFFDLGAQPAANALKNQANQTEEFFPLRLVFCDSCKLVQLEDTIDKGLLFNKYFWVTGTSHTARDYSNRFYERTVKAIGLNPGDKIVEIASNDGTFLRAFQKGGMKVLGVDPAQNIAEMANKDGVPTLARFWNAETAQEVLKDFGRPKMVFARNVIPHVAELRSVIQGIADVLDDSGTGIIEFHSAETILRELHYDSIYHEHLCYFSIHSMRKLLQEFGLKAFHVDSSPISGGSHVIYFSKQERQASPSLENAQKNENASGINELATWKRFAQNSEDHKRLTLEALKEFSGKKVIGFGASARSSTYLNYCGVGAETLNCIIDNNPLKQNLWSPGTSIPIVSQKDGLAQNPDLIFILGWNLGLEIMKSCRNAGYRGPFLMPFPSRPHFIAAGVDPEQGMTRGLGL